MYDKAQMDAISPQEKMGRHGAGLVSPAHDEAIRDGISIPRGARVLRIKDVIDRTGLSRSTLYALMKSDPTFPKKVSLSVRTTGVIEQQLDAWIAMRASSHAVA
ncbi:prophage CP4-57 regulatory protein (AlpA) [Burkholderia pseudomallei]|uniref:helix-turn-helix transcriptional regulator n=1 Tax=Burkholderia pseudomallei TaxID=28450 RepID=UPI000F0E4ED8|nr:AlpA family transcriptional regulator [Burkholderia pseudomallei]CAJ2995407.1 prophage CP4-57 regulatory protein (AlpA) [Burkholderia pseudomallei]CAJ6494221.1 prophage CP4-57 regulatory protein (AlpA) [Burkholderia pseudomallei]VCG64305.1 prophage CP4-57 regulatory protein (AlpA) [Burkholderia pseudomallei]VCH01679.1 prophage CP4-57 regulatory protein (AlpA) [Burkholderia pseudomallei]VCH05891.1 prophage CP4-57 regulatory protein (AlpA) [Burkholderia pseudomallei]